MFADRADAGRQLAAKLLRLKKERPVLLALPRGGVPVAFEVAVQLESPLGLVFVRKLGAPFNPEFAVGAVADGAEPVVVLHEPALAMLGLSREHLQPAIDRDLDEICQRRKTYGPDAIPEDLEGRTVILVDDGIATGATMEAAVEWVRRRHPGRIVIAVPIGSPTTLASLAKAVDEVVCVEKNKWFSAVGSAYQNFAQVDDATVTDLLRRAAEARKVDDRANTTGA